VAMSENARNNQVFEVKCWKGAPLRAANARIQVKITTTEVRTAVARLASTPATPIFARIAVAAANTADSKDQASHVIRSKLPRERTAYFT